MRTITGLLLCLGLLVAHADAAQPTVYRWRSNPADGCGNVDCASFTSERACAKIGEGGGFWLGNAGCCQWNSGTQSCTGRPCSYFEEANCNAAPHCGWSHEDIHLTPEGKPQCVERSGCTGMFEKTCKKYFQYCRWRKDLGECKDLPLPTPARVADDSACFGMPMKSCKWWMNHGSTGPVPDCVWTGKWGCENLETINRRCWWKTPARCMGAKNNGYDCNWNKKLKKCTVYKELSCYDLVGWTPENAMTIRAARRSCCSDPELGEQVKGAAGTTCTKPKLGKYKFNDCRWCEDHSDTPRCVKAKNCPFNGARDN